MNKKVLFYGATGLLTFMVLGTIANSMFNPEFANRFSNIGYPKYLIAPLMIAKLIGLIVIWFNRNIRLLEWAYSGFFFLFLLAFLAELHAPVPDYFSPIVALGLLSLSYRFKRNRYPRLDTGLERRP